MTGNKTSIQLTTTQPGKNGKNEVELSVIKSELRYRRLFEAAQDGILILNAETGMIIDVNPFLIQLLGYSRDEILKKNLWEMGAFKDIKASKEAFNFLKKNEYIRYKDLPLRSKDGRIIPVEFVSNIYIEGNEKVIQCNIRDITERKKAHDVLREQSVRDFLTGLYNRRYMVETLERELRRVARKQLPLGLIMADIDEFKKFNDTWGHASGDIVLRELSNFFQQNVRQEDIACRYGGDEFIIVLPEASQSITYERAEHIRTSSKQLQFVIAEQRLSSITLSLGVAIFPADGFTKSAILESVDTALYRAKHEGRDRVALSY